MEGGVCNTYLGGEMPEEILRAVPYHNLEQVTEKLNKLSREMVELRNFARPLKASEVEMDAGTMLSEFVHRHVAKINSQYGTDWKWEYELDTPLPLAKISSPGRMTDFIIHRGIHTAFGGEAYPDTCNLMCIHRLGVGEFWQRYTIDICHYTSESPRFKEALRESK